MNKMLKIKNTYENNLKNISLNIPKNKITSIIGVSGSGKSSLIYGVLANEAKRREKIDSNNANCIDYAVRSKFESIENLPYCITLKQRGLNQSSSSTLATLSKLHELLRYEFVKYGKIISENNNIIERLNAKEIGQYINKYHTKNKLDIFAIVCDKKFTDGAIELNLLKENNINEAIFISSYDEKEKLKKVSTQKELNSKYNHTILIPIKSLEELESFEKIAKESFLLRGKDLEIFFNYDYPDLLTGKIYQQKSTELLSFNSIGYFGGRCTSCNGVGKIESIDIDLLVNKDKKLNEYFLNLEDNRKECYKYIGLCKDSIELPLVKQKISLSQTYYDLSKEHQDILKNIIYPKILKHKAKSSIGRFVKSIECPTCRGTRLNYKANAVKLYGVSISEILTKTVDELYLFLEDKELHHKKILTILKALQKATLGYLALNRTTDTLSGGELQRLKFALELNSEYKNLLYILDEPSTGLHSYNNHQMIHLIKNLRDKGNTVIISEHNQDYIEESDFIVELGYGSGEAGGEIVFSGEKKIFKIEEFKRDKLKVNLKNAINLKGVSSNNILNEDFTIPLNCLVAISGVSGSGKSSLIHKVLVPTLKQYIADKTIDNTILKSISNIENIKDVVEVTQSQIGINSRSIVATYLEIFDKIRDIYTATYIAKEFSFDRGYFSFNSTGACVTCKGMGELEEMICPNCLGQRYKAEVLDVRYKELNIMEFLNSPIEKLALLFDDEKLIFAFEILRKLGLSHISLGRTTPTLSGGEAQRLKLAKELIDSFAKIKKGNFLFILDEPTTGLSAKDTAKIYGIFDEILSFNNSIIIIEHNLEIIKNSDFIIDIGLGSGKDGGKNLFSGSFEELLKHKTSLTAKAFNKEYEEIGKIEIDKINLKEKKYTDVKVPNCNKFYLDDKHFKIEKEYAKKYEVKTDDVKNKYFKTKEKLFSFVNSLEDVEISFNPFVTELFQYKIVPVSLKREKLKHLKKLGFTLGVNDYKIDEWDFRIKSKEIEKAYNFGNGWISVKSKNITYELFTRLVSKKYKIIGVPKIDEHTFNLYLNSCVYCEGAGTKECYDKKLIIKDENKSIMTDGFFNSNIKIALKSIISRFEKEGLFDFNKPFSKLSKEEQDIFLFGFIEHRFLKPKGRVNAISDYVRWQGLYSYIYTDLKKIKISDKIKKSQHKEVCPFCKSGFKNEVEYYLNEGASILSYL